jgi:flagellar hook-associated protein 2
LAERINDLINEATNGTRGTIAREAGIEGASSQGSNIIARQITANQQRLGEMLTFLARREEYFYSMFSRLEAAMMQSNTQLQYMQAMLGQGMQ